MDKDIIDYIALGISVLTAVGSLMGYVLHGRRLNRQEAKLNEYALKEQQEAETAKLKAEIRVSAIYNRGGSNYIIVKNEGLAPASNIRIDSKCMSGSNRYVILRSNDIFPIPYLAPGGEIKAKYSLVSPEERTPLAVATWDDDYGKDRRSVHSLNISD